ncbi:hypothetical protein GO491_06245 [Flavobacteriaceae bacterium Ap0902]|nr:hypothetical protein [Flavobacteriaceae bacterium Ap0902]
MSQVTRNIISTLLAMLIIMINVAELAATINHFTHHHHIENNLSLDDDHSDCHSFCSHISNQNLHDVCDGHFLNFMPQITTGKLQFEIKQKIELAINQPIFLRVKQYSSSYTHLFTSRPPPFMA